jgi:hypothetical protein
MEALDRGRDEPPQEGEITRTFEGESQRLQAIENKWFPRIKWKRIRMPDDEAADAEGLAFT